MKDVSNDLGTSFSVGLSQCERDDLERLILAPEELLSNDTLRSKLEELEQDVGRLARLVFLLDSQLAALAERLSLTERRNRELEDLVEELNQPASERVSP